MRHLYCYKGFYYFHSRVPSDLQAIFQRRTIKKALRTNDFKTAVSSVKLVSNRFDSIIKVIRSGILKKEEIERIVDNFFVSHLEFSDFMHLSSMPKTQEEKEEALKNCDEWIEKYNKYRDENSPHIEGVLKKHLAKANITISDTSYDFLQLKRAFLTALIEATKIQKERIQGNLNNRYDNFLSVLKPNGTTTFQPELIPKKEKGKMLSEVIDKFCQEKITKEEWNNKNRDENIAFYKQFLQIVGNRGIKEYIRDDFLKVIEIYKKIPKNLDKVKDVRDKPLSEILTLIEGDELKDYEVLDVTTINKNITRFNAVFRYALQHGYITVNYADGLKIKGKKKAREQRKVYDANELTKWVTSPIYTECSVEKILERPERFWVLLIMMFNGCRNNEVCQLYKEDVKEIDGIWCIDINDEKDKKVKTAESVRIVPIHPSIIKLGFLKYVASVDHERIFPSLRTDEKQREGYSYLFNKWCERYNRQYISDDKKKVPYSLRHNFITNLKEQDISETLVAEITGHTIESMTYGRYGKSYGIPTRFETVKKVNYGIDLSHLKFPLKKKQ
jgi:integrase